MLHMLLLSVVVTSPCAAAIAAQTELTAYERFAEPRQVEVLHVTANKKELGTAFKKVKRNSAYCHQRAVSTRGLSVPLMNGAVRAVR